MLKIILTAALFATAAATAAPALAQPEGTTRTVHVTYADLDLSRTADVKLFDRRLRVALRSVCPGSAGATPIAVLQCRKTAHAALADQRSTAIAKAAGTTRLALNTIAR